MGIFCKIHLDKPSDHIYQPGEMVSGIIKYTLDRPMDIEKLSTTLHGRGKLRMDTMHPKSIFENRDCSEHYIRIQNIIQDTKTKTPLGNYELKFDFILPSNIPSTTLIRRYLVNGIVYVNIKYFIRIEFETPGLFENNNHFKKEIIVVSRGMATLPMEPVTYEETKKWSHLFSSKDSTVKVKVTVMNSVIPIGGKITAHCEIDNNSNVKVKSVETKLTEIYDFNLNGHHERSEKTVPNTGKTSGSINSGKSQIIDVDLCVPADIFSLDYSIIISRRYALQVSVVLPIPYKDVVLNIPVQIGVISGNTDFNRLNKENKNLSLGQPLPTQ